MFEKRPFGKLGGDTHGWLDTRHHFSFADYYDPARMHWGNLRVWNDDTIQPGTGFPLHPHADMEIITYVREGAITHQDDMGNQGRTTAGDVQVMSAGTGVRHSEYNHESEPTTIYQIWILTNQRGAPPAWGTRPFPKGDRSGKFVVLASGNAADRDALPIRADARVLGATVGAGQAIEYSFASPARYGYLVLAKGQARIGDLVLDPGDGLAIHDEAAVRLVATQAAEIVLVDAA